MLNKATLSDFRPRTIDARTSLSATNNSRRDINKQLAGISMYICVCMCVCMCVCEPSSGWSLSIKPQAMRRANKVD